MESTVSSLQHEIDEIVRAQERSFYMIAAASVVAMTALGAFLYWFTRRTAEKEKTGIRNAILEKAALQARVLTAVLKMNRFVQGGLSDDKFFSAPRTLGANPYAQQPGDHMAVLHGGAGGDSNSSLQSYNLAIIIGVDTPETPGASADAAKVKALFDAEGSYTTCLFASGGFKPTSVNIAQVLKQLQDAQRVWRSVVIYIAAPLRPVPCDWFDPRRLLKSNAETMERRTAPAAFASPKEQPAFFLEFPSDHQTASDEQTWIGITTLLRRVKAAVAAGGSPATFPIALLLDAAYDSSKVADGVKFMHAVEKDGLPGTFASVSGGAPTALNMDPRVALPEGVTDYLAALPLHTAVERSLQHGRIDCVVLGNARVLAAAGGVKLKKPKLISLGVVSGRTVSIDASTSMLVRALLEGFTGASSPQRHGQLGSALEGMRSEMHNLQQSPLAASGILTVPVSTADTSCSIFHRCFGSLASIADFARYRAEPACAAEQGVAAGAISEWRSTIFLVDGDSAMSVGPAVTPLFEQGSLMPHRVPPTPFAEWRVVRPAEDKSSVDHLAALILQLTAPRDRCIAVVCVDGRPGVGKTAVCRATAWSPVLLRGFSTGVVWIDLLDFSSLEMDADDFVVEVTDAMASCLWPIVGGLADPQSAQDVWTHLLTGANALVFLDHLDTSRFAAHQRLVELVNQAAVSTRSQTAAGAPPMTGIFCAAVVLIRSTDAADVPSAAHFEVTPLPPASIVKGLIEPELRSAASEDVEGRMAARTSGLEDVMRASTSNMWLAHMLAGTISVVGKLPSSAARSEHFSALDSALLAFTTSSGALLASRLDVFVNDVTDLAIATAASHTGVPFERIVDVLAHITAHPQLLQLPSPITPAAALRFHIHAWSDRILIPALLSVGLLSSSESQRPRRIAGSTAVAACLALSPLVANISHHVRHAPAEELDASDSSSAILRDQGRLRRALVTIRAACRAIVSPPRHNHDLLVLQRDPTYAATMIRALCAAEGPQPSLSGPLFDSTTARDAFAMNMGFLKMLAATVTDRAFLALLTAAAQNLVSPVREHFAMLQTAFETYFARCPLRLRNSLEPELLTQLTIHLPLQSESRRLLLGDLDRKLRSSLEGNSAESSKDQEMRPEEQDCDAGSPFNCFDLQELHFEIPLGKSRSGRWGAPDEAGAESDTSSEGGGRADAAAGPEMTAEMLDLQPQFREFALLPLANSFCAFHEGGAAACAGQEASCDDLPREKVSAATFVGGFLFVGTRSGKVMKCDANSGALLRSHHVPEHVQGGNAGVVAIIPYFTAPATESCTGEPAPPVPRLVTVSTSATGSGDTSRVIALWSDLELAEYSLVPNLTPPGPAQRRQSRFSDSMNVARLVPSLCEAGVNVALRTQEQLQSHRDLDYARFAEVYPGAEAATDLLESGLRRRQEKGRRATSLLVAFHSDEDGDSVGWNQRVVLAKIPEESVCAATVTLASTDAPLRAVAAGAAPSGAARVAVIDDFGRLRLFCLVSYAVRDAAHVKQHRLQEAHNPTATEQEPAIQPIDLSDLI